MTVSCVSMGGLGNILFQFACTISYALKHNINYCLPTEIRNPHYPDQKIFYSKHLTYCKEGIVTATVFKEPHFHYAEIPAPKSNFTLLQGYWQSARYFSDYREEILKLFDIPYERKEGWCSLHVRRNDYLKLQNFHPVITNEYIEEAQIYMMNKGIFKFMVFSDDIEYCKTSMPFYNDCEYIFSEGKTEVEDLSLASSCQHSIGSNSAFSWWIYYLNQNKNKIGVFPTKDKWFGESLPHNVDDLYMPEWKLI